MFPNSTIWSLIFEQLFMPELWSFLTSFSKIVSFAAQVVVSSHVLLILSQQLCALSMVMFFQLVEFLR